jgi:hypothetical protein
MGLGGGVPRADRKRVAPLLRSRRSGLLRQRMLGSEALYEVLDSRGSLVWARVLSAPGLEPGTRVRLSRQAVRAMERIEPAEAQQRPRPAAPPVVRQAGARPAH